MMKNLSMMILAASAAVGNAQAEEEEQLRTGEADIESCSRCPGFNSGPMEENMCAGNWFFTVQLAQDLTPTKLDGSRVMTTPPSCAPWKNEIYNGGTAWSEAERYCREDVPKDQFSRCQKHIEQERQRIERAVCLLFENRRYECNQKTRRAAQLTKWGVCDAYNQDLPLCPEVENYYPDFVN